MEDKMELYLVVNPLCNVNRLSLLTQTDLVLFSQNIVLV